MNIVNFALHFAPPGNLLRSGKLHSAKRNLIGGFLREKKSTWLTPRMEPRGPREGTGQRKCTATPLDFPLLVLKLCHVDPTLKVVCHALFSFKKLS